MHGVKARHDLLTSVDYLRSYSDLRSDLYDIYIFLCHNNTMCTVFLVCNCVTRIHCKLSTGVRSFEKATGASILKKHLDVNLKKENDIVRLGIIEDWNKPKLHDASPRCAVLDALPFIFTIKTGMLEFTKDIFDVGHCLPDDIKCNVKNLLTAKVTIKSVMPEWKERFVWTFPKNGRLQVVWLGPSQHTEWLWGLQVTNITHSMFITSMCPRRHLLHPQVLSS